MAYRFKKDEPLSSAVKRVFAEEISWAVGHLAHSRKRAEAVHEARKSIKKIRGLLSLIGGQIGPARKIQDRYFRDAGRHLSDFRDSTVMLQTFDGLAEKHPALDLKTIKEMRQSLRRPGRHTTAEKKVSSEVVHLLEESRLQADSWPLADLQFEMLVPAMTATYRGGRRAFKRAQKADNTEALHDFRKKVKEHWYHLRLFEGAGDADLKKRVNDLDELGTCLGDEHNLSVLRARLNAEIETKQDRQKIGEVINWLDAEANSLRKHALETGEHLYGAKASVFAERLVHLALSLAAKPPASSAPLRARSAVA